MNREAKRIEEIKRKIDIIKNTDLPEEVKEVGILGVLMGADNDRIIRAMVEVASAIETKKAEEEHPIRPMPEDYTEIERVIHEMLIENTGAHILDSGFAYGRHWERNREISDFRKEPVVYVTVWKDGDFTVSISVFHYLTTFLEIDDRARELNKMLDEFLKKNPDLSYFAVAEEFARQLEDYGFKVCWAFNTYNGESLLSQGLQGIFLSFGSEDYPNYVILQIHNGCDIRGGYTRPRVFKIIDFEEMIIADKEIYAHCDCTNVHSDDCGYHWYSVEGEGFPEYWKPRPKKPNARRWEYKLVCEKCGKDVEFSVRWQ